MRWTVRDVPDPLDWKTVDCRTGMEFSLCREDAGWNIVLADDERGLVVFQHVSAHFEDDVVEVRAPRVLMDVARKSVLMFYNPPNGESEERARDVTEALAAIRDWINSVVVA